MLPSPLPLPHRPSRASQHGRQQQRQLLRNPAVIFAQHHKAAHHRGKIVTKRHYTTKPPQQSLHSTTQQRHHRRKTVTKRHYTTKPRCSLCIAPHGNVTTEGKLLSKGTTQRNPLQSLHSTTRQRHHRGKTVTKRHYTTKSYCNLLHNTTRQRTIKEKLWPKGTT